MHNIVPHNSPQERHSTKARVFFAKRCKWIRLFSEVSISKASAHLGLPQAKFQVMPEGSYINYYTNTTDSASARTMLDIDKSDFVILYFGSVSPYKGIETLVNAYEELKNNVPVRVRIIIAGYAADEAYGAAIANICAKYPDVICNLSKIEDDAIQYYMLASNIACFPFRQIENSGSVILAMGFGLPIVAPNMGVVAHRLQKQKYLCYDEGKLLKTLLQAYQTPVDMLKKIGEYNKLEVQRTKWSNFGKLFKD